MTRYLDTSLLVSALTAEAATDRVLSWLARPGPADLTISDWVVTEFASALSVKIRMGQLHGADRARAAGVFLRLQAESLMVVPVTRDHLRMAARFAEQSGLGLPAGDAVHVAVAAQLAATICTLDKHLADVAVALGVSAEMV